MQRTLHTHSVSIGASDFDPAKPPIIFPGLRLTSEWVVPRLISLVAPLALLPVAALFFHRFDPVRTKQISGKGRRNWIGKIQNLFKPLSRRAVKLLTLPGRGGSFLGCDVDGRALTLTLLPVRVRGVRRDHDRKPFAPPAGMLPIVFAVLAVIVSDVATRDGRGGTVASLRAIRG